MLFKNKKSYLFKTTIVVICLFLFCLSGCKASDKDDTMQMETISWSTRRNAQQIPIAKSSLGYIRNNNDVRFEVYLANTTFEDFNDYINECISKGFTIGAQHQEHRYYAKNDANYELTVEHLDGDIMRVEIVEATYNVNIKISHVNEISSQKYNLDILIDDFTEDTIKRGDMVCAFDTYLNEFPHSLKLVNSENEDILGIISFEIKEESSLEFEIYCSESAIQIGAPGTIVVEQATASSVEYSNTDTKTQTENSKENTSTSNYSSNIESNTSDNLDNNDVKLSDSEIEDLAVLTLYQQLLAYEEKYNSIDAESCRYSINKIDHVGKGQVEVYGVVFFYDKHGSITKLGYDYQKNFTIHMTEHGDLPWCEMQ